MFGECFRSALHTLTCIALKKRHLVSQLVVFRLMQRRASAGHLYKTNLDDGHQGITSTCLLKKTM